MGMNMVTNMTNTADLTFAWSLNSKGEEIGYAKISRTLVITACKAY